MIRNLDLDLLRSFAAVAELGSISGAAQRVGRTQSAVSLQMDRLSEQVGFPVIERKGRGVILTARGGAFLDDARHLLDLNDRILAQHVHGTFAQPLRLGFVQDVGETAMQRILARLAAPVSPGAHHRAGVLHPDLAGSSERGGPGPGRGLPARQRPAGAGGGARAHALVRRPAFPAGSGQPVPLLLFEQPCVFRAAAISALTAAGRPFRVAFTSPSLPGLMAAVGAGLGVTVRSPRAMRPELVAVTDLASAPLPEVEFVLYGRSETAQPALQQVEAVIREEVRCERPLFAAA